MSNIDRFIYSIVGSIGITLLALILGYFWARAIGYPFTPRQRKMWIYYVLFVSSFPVLCPLFVGMARWVIPLNLSAAITIFLLIVWMVITFYIVRRMSRPGGRLSQERQGQH